MTSDELNALFRASIGDAMRPYIWSDEEVYAFMNDAYYMFVRLTGGVPDHLSDICLLTASANEPFADLDPRVLVVRSASLEPNGDVVKVINAQDMERLSDEDYGVLRRINAPTSKGKIRYMVVGMQPDIVRWVNIPDRSYEVRLLIDRLPLSPITGAGQRFVDAKDHHHIHFLKWMKHLAYNNHGTEEFEKARSEFEKLEFMTYCELAKREKERYKHKVRVVAYGGI